MNKTQIKKLKKNECDDMREADVSVSGRNFT